MAEETNVADFAVQEGNQAIPDEGGNGEDTPSDSPTGNNDSDGEQEGDDVETGPDGGNGGQEPDGGQEESGTGKGNVPFHKNPRWKQREQEWQGRFSEQQKAHERQLRQVLEKVGVQDQEPGRQSRQRDDHGQPPSWWGGDEAGWKQYVDWQRNEIRAVEDRVRQEMRQADTKRQEAVDAATEFLNSEIAAIATDPELNPDGSRIDRNRLVKATMDNDLVDSRGRWNYRAGYALMRAQGAKAAPAGGGGTGGKPAKKRAAAATGGGGGKPAAPKGFKTSEDFRGNRPW